MEFHQQFTSTPYKHDRGYGTWYQHCNCCPYGYHIDLDFVRYCEKIGQQQVERTGSFKRRRDRRRQRQSMEVLLGLEPPPIFNNIEIHHKLVEEESTSRQKQLNLKQTFLLQDGLEEAVSDFERTLQRSNKLSNNLPDVTAVHETVRRVPSVSSMSSTSGSSMTVLPSTTDGTIRDYDVVSIESCGLSPAALQNIREQMALSLERTKELEERVKLVPSLQAQLSALKEEKRQLLLQIKASERGDHVEPKAVNGNYITNSSYARLRSNSLTHSTSFECIDKRLPAVPRRDVGTTCTVLTRNVGVGHQHPNTKSVATITLNGESEFIDGYSDKWYNEKIKFLSNDRLAAENKPTGVAKGTQTTLIKEKKHKCHQFPETPQVQIKHDKPTQTAGEPKKISHNVYTSAAVPTSDASIGTVINVSTVGVSDDTTDDVLCAKCNDDKSKKESLKGSAISLASLAVRSKSFNMGDDKLNLRNRTIGCQYESFNSHKACQSEVLLQSTKACQHEIKCMHKAIQFESFASSKFTDTKDLTPVKKDTACNTKGRDTAEASSNTVEPTETTPCRKCAGKKEKEEIRKEENAMPSRIPRPQIPTTPVENRKFRRQDTYTKIPAAANETSGLSGLDLSSKHDNELPSPLEKVKQSCKLLPEVPLPHNGASSSSKAEPKTTLTESELCQTSAQSRKKAKPSKEMQAAMKVLNDSLQKGQANNLKNQLKNAINIIQQEWFKISSLVNANPLDVEDYLDCFEDVSFDLLRYIVNMVDVSGNTAMHYAVSHGNFDVVSILLDSKVCDINQPNKAGYTSVMLVSLANVVSSTHANVVRRLFQLADVNIRAKQHGQTALMLAVSQGRLDMVQMLLEAGADINIQDEDGSTALMCAAEHGHIDIVKHFLSQPDCDSTIIDVDGSTALKIAMEAGHRPIGVLLYAHERNLQGAHGSKKRNKSASASPNPPSSPLPLRSSRRALTDSRSNK